MDFLTKIVYGNRAISKAITRAAPILPANFFEKYEFKSKEQNFGKNR